MTFAGRNDFCYVLDVTLTLFLVNFFLVDETAGWVEQLSLHIVERVCVCCGKMRAFGPREECVPWPRI